MDYKCIFIEEIFNEDDEFIKYVDTIGYLDITMVADIVTFVDKNGTKRKEATKVFKIDGTYCIIKEPLDKVYQWKQQAKELPLILPN